jgi:hypothetical protein
LTTTEEEGGERIEAKRAPIHGMPSGRTSASPAPGPASSRITATTRRNPAIAAAAA